MARRLHELLHGLVEQLPVADCAITGISTDSRRVQAGDLFVALSGTREQGHYYIKDALERGAVVALHERGAGALVGAVTAPVIAVDHLREKLGTIAARFYGQPASAMTVIGVTGTNGKTTCTHLLAQALDEPGTRCGLIGTLGAGFPGELEPLQHTTPDAVSLHRQLAELRRRGAGRVCMEVSSHGIEQGRVAGIQFDVAVFTNLSRDHLDYHGDMESYAAAKARLFDWPGLRAAVVNAEDPFGRSLIEKLRDRLELLSFGLGSGDVHTLRLRPTANGLELRITTPGGEVSFDSPLIGRFNAANLLAVLCCLRLLGMDLDEAARRLARVQPVAGRMEQFRGREGWPLVVVDYAHTPDALEQSLIALREHTGGRLICVFGCGGDRDRGKRPLMGQVAERLADLVVLTDDNPRSEAPADIVTAIRAGMESEPTVIHDRIAAIEWAITSAQAGDTVLVAGKGHEQDQQIGDLHVPMNDRATVVRALGLAA